MENAWWFYVLLVAAPVLAIVARPRGGGVVIWTLAATWAVTTFAVGGVADDDIAVFAFVVLPILIVVTSTVVATSLAPEPRRWFEAGFFALAGCWSGLMVMVFTPWHVLAGTWDDAMFVGLPTVFGASGAAFGATFPRR